MENRKIENEQADFLRRILWANRTILENFFCFSSFEKMLEQNSPYIESIIHADGKKYYSFLPGNYHLLFRRCSGALNRADQLSGCSGK